MQGNGNRKLILVISYLPIALSLPYAKNWNQAEELNRPHLSQNIPYFPRFSLQEIPASPIPSTYLFLSEDSDQQISKISVVRPIIDTSS